MHQTPGSVLQIHLRLRSYVSGVCRGAPAGNPVRKSKQLGNNTADLFFFFSLFLPCFCGGRARWGWVGASWGATAIINLLALTQSFVWGAWGVGELGKSCSSRADDLQQRCGFHLEGGPADEVLRPGGVGWSASMDTGWM